VTGVTGFAGQFGGYPIVTATGGLNGQFRHVAAVMTPFPFLGASLAYTDDTAVFVIGHAGGTSFASVGQTGNQTAAGGALDQLPSSSPLLQSAPMLSLASAPAVLTALSATFILRAKA
jgi:uncharacterized protein with beta-barrel porin domain